MFICRTWSVLTYLHALSPSKTMQHSIHLDLKQKKIMPNTLWCWPKCILWTNQPAVLLLIYPLYVKGVLRVWTSDMSSYWWFIPDCLWNPILLVDNLLSYFVIVKHPHEPVFIPHFQWICHGYVMDMSWILLIYHDIYI